MAGLVPLVLFLTSILVTYGIRLLVLHFKVIDIPNTRSSHGVPTPKGGGLGFALIIIVLMLLPQAMNLWVLAITAFAISVIGFIDDVKEVPSSIRFSIQSLCALAFLASVPLNGLTESLMIPLWTVYLLGFFFILWLTNLYNFMDGIDGLAAIQGILLGAALLLLKSTTGYPGELSSLFIGLSIVLLGFLLFNAPPARIFMGDAGSAFLGFSLAGLCLFEASAHLDCLWLILVLLAGFVSDASATLLCRLFRKQKVYQAHRSHLYQLIVQDRQQRLIACGLEENMARTRAHRVYLAMFIACFVSVQLPVAALVAQGLFDGFWAVMAVYTLLVGLHLWAGAGQHRLFPYGRLCH